MVDRMAASRSIVKEFLTSGNTYALRNWNEDVHSLLMRNSLGRMLEGYLRVLDDFGRVDLIFEVVDEYVERVRSSGSRMSMVLMFGIQVAWAAGAKGQLSRWIKKFEAQKTPPKKIQRDIAKLLARAPSALEIASNSELTPKEQVRFVNFQLPKKGYRLAIGSADTSLFCNTDGELCSLVGGKIRHLSSKGEVSPAGFGPRLELCPGLDEAQLYWSGKFTYWLIQRYGTTMLIQSGRYTTYGVKTDVHFMTWSPTPQECDDLRALLDESRKKGLRQSDAFYRKKLGESLLGREAEQKDALLFRMYSKHPDSFTNNDPNSHLGVRGRDVVRFSGTTDPMMELAALRGEVGESSEEIVTLSQHTSHEEAVRAFYEMELGLFKAGYRLWEIAPLPVRPHTKAS